MAYVILVDGVVTAYSPIPQPGMDGFVEVSDSDSRLLAFLAPDAQQAAATLLAPRLANGIALTSTGTPALNATYALDAVSTAQVFQIGSFAASFGMFPSGGSTLAYPDITGTPHTFTVPEFIAFLKALASLVSALSTQAAIGGNGGTPTWPAQDATIA